jgi:hypothetical protein
MFVPVRILLDNSSATDEQRAAWESLVRVSVSTGINAVGKPVEEVDPDYEAYQWYMAMKASSQPLFTYSGWMKAGKPAADAGRSRGGCVR